MAEDEAPKIHVDSDWKQEAQREKERLAKETEETGRGGPLPPPSFLDIVNLILMQAVIGLGGMQGPGGQRIPPNLDAAKHHIDLLGVLQEKTKGNLTEEEQQTLDAALYEIRMRFVSIVGGAAGAPPTPPPQQPEA